MITAQLGYFIHIWYQTTFLSCTGGIDLDQTFIDVRMNAIKRKIIVLSGKGGM